MPAPDETGLCMPPDLRICMAKRRDHYEVLGVKKRASIDEIKRAYRTLSKKYHPDRNPNNPSAEAMFKEVQNAYSVLNDPKKRAQYDDYGDVGVGEWQTRPTGEKVYQWGGGSSVRSEDLEDLFSAFGSRGGGNRSGGIGEGIFEQIFGGGQRGARNAARRPPPEQVHNVELSFDQAVHGTKLSLRIERGDGEESIEVKIPPGVETGQKIRVRGQVSSANGGPSGDIILFLHVAPHPYFRREGADIYLDVPVSVTEAVLGAKIEVPTLEGRGTVTLPPGTPSGGKLRLRGQGVIKRGTSERGDQYVVVQIVPPKSLTDEEKALYEKLRDIGGHDPRKKASW